MPPDGSLAETQGSHPPSSARSRRSVAPTGSRSCSTARSSPSCGPTPPTWSGELGERLGGETLAVNKFNVAEVLACETHFLAPSPFAWTPASPAGRSRTRRSSCTSTGAVSRRPPSSSTTRSLGSVTTRPRSATGWLRCRRRRGRPAGPGDRPGHLVRRVLPAAASRLASGHRGPGALAGRRPDPARAKADIVIGRAAGAESRKVLIDLKAGRIYDRHREDLRFYALVETLAREVPPRMVASFSLEAGEAVVDDVSAGMLRTSLRRTLDAIERMVELTVEGRPPRPLPSASCFRCRELAELPDRDEASADDVDLVADGEVVPDGHGVGRAYADAP